MLKKWVLFLGVCACTGLFAAAGQQSSVVALSDTEAIGIRGGGTVTILERDCQWGWVCSAETCSYASARGSGLGEFASPGLNSTPCGNGWFASCGGCLPGPFQRCNR